MAVLRQLDYGCAFAILGSLMQLDRSAAFSMEISNEHKMMKRDVASSCIKMSTCVLGQSFVHLFYTEKGTKAWHCHERHKQCTRKSTNKTNMPLPNSLQAKPSLVHLLSDAKHINRHCVPMNTQDNEQAQAQDHAGVPYSLETKAK